MDLIKFHWNRLLLLILAASSCFATDDEVSRYYEDHGLTQLIRELTLQATRCAYRNDARSEITIICGQAHLRKSDFIDPEYTYRLRNSSGKTIHPATSFWANTDKKRTQASALRAGTVPVINAFKFIQISEYDSNRDILNVDGIDESLSQSGEAAHNLVSFLLSEAPLNEDKHLEQYVLNPNTYGSFSKSTVFSKLSRAGQNYLLSHIENATFDLYWIRKLLETDFDPAMMDARQFLAFIDTICLKIQDHPILPPAFLPDETNKRTRLIAFREFLKLQSIRHHMSTPGRKIIAEIHQRLGFPGLTNLIQEKIDSSIYILGKALAQQSDLKAISNRLLQSNIPACFLELAAKHVLLRHPQVHNVLDMIGLNLAKHPIPLIQSPNLHKKLTFVGSIEPIGDGVSPDKMDFFCGKQYPWLSLILPILIKLGYTFEVLDWQDPTIDWSKRRCIFIGPVWGYSKHGDAFNRWLEQRRIEGIKLVNPLSFLRWNAEKTYLSDLQTAGIPVVPTYITKNESLQDLLKIAKSKWDTTDVIFKGVIGAGGFDYLHHTDPEITTSHLKKLMLENNGIVMQPFCPEVSQTGEVSFVFIGNFLSHMYLKVCKKGEERVQVFYGGRSFHFTDKYGNNPPKRVKGDILQFKNKASIKASDLEKTEQQAYYLWSLITDYMTKNDIPPPPVCRLDCISIKNILHVMEIEGLDPYLEFKEASQYVDLKILVPRYTNELLRQYTLNG